MRATLNVKSVRTAKKTPTDRKIGIDKKRCLTECKIGIQKKKKT